MASRTSRARGRNLDFRQRQHLHLPFRRRRVLSGRPVWRDHHLALHCRKARHLDFYCPCPIRQTGKRKNALLAGARGELCFALHRRRRRARNRQPVKFDLALIPETMRAWRKVCVLALRPLWKPRSVTKRTLRYNSHARHRAEKKQRRTSRKMAHVSRGARLCRPVCGKRGNAELFFNSAAFVLARQKAAEFL